MKTEDFNFELPQSLIAQYPPDKRGESRLFVLDRGAAPNGARSLYTHSSIHSLQDFLEPGTIMVFNDSKVRKARIFATAEDTGASVEFLLVAPHEISEAAIYDPFGAPSSVFWRAISSKTRRQRVGRAYIFPEGVRGVVYGELGDEKVLKFDRPIDDAYLEKNGHIPLPPYIKREDGAMDSERYQTIYAKVSGSAASPTAGLHFTREVLKKIEAKGIETHWITLHVGLGTFLPVRSVNVEEHRMHGEIFHIPAKTADAVNLAKQEGRKVLAVGTTSLRALESAWDGDSLASGTFGTKIFIYPGYRFKVVDTLFTNFHTPMSTLLMLVSAFAGRETILAAYKEAVAKSYRFFSYGDAMLIL